MYPLKTIKLNAEEVEAHVFLKMRLTNTACRGSAAHFSHDSHVFFMYKMLCSEYARMQDFASNFQKTWGPVQIQI